jgi:hypothetical protein
MKKLILYLIWSIYSIRSLFVLFKYILKKEIIILDLDNTLIDTASELKSKDYTFNDAYFNAKLRYDFILKIKQKHLFENNYIIISARNFIYHELTKKYLNNHPDINYNFILVPNPISKILIYKYFFKNKKLFIYDDLSGGHEHGLITYYTENINKILKLNNVYLFHSLDIENCNI